LCRILNIAIVKMGFDSKK